MDLVHRRLEAIRIGEELYFTGELCSRGHLSPRRARSGGCIDCETILRREYRKKRRAAGKKDNPPSEEQRQIRNARKRAKRRVAGIPPRRKYTTLEERKAARALYRKRHESKRKTWLKKHPHLRRIYEQKRRAKKRATGGSVSTDIVKRLMKSQRQRCACCMVALKETSYHLDHIIPIARGGRNIDRNIQLLCVPCNLAKSSRDPIEFMQSRGFLL